MIIAIIAFNIWHPGMYIASSEGLVECGAGDATAAEADVEASVFEVATAVDPKGEPRQGIEVVQVKP